MKCLICKHGTPKPGVTNFTVERDGVLVVIRHVPASICEICGEEYFDDSITDELYKQVDGAIKAGQEVSIQEFQQAA